MERNTIISVVVPVYKVEQYLPKCVDSILNQTYSNLEVILVDDGSPDSCPDLCDAYAVSDSRVKVIHKRNGGLSSARNAGIDIASGEYIAFVDSDDWLEPDTYSVLLETARKHNASIVCAGRYDIDEATGQKDPGLCPEREEEVSGAELVRRIFRWNNLDSAAWDKLYRRDLFLDIRYPDGKIMEDVPTTYRLALKAGNAVLLNKRFYNYLHRAGSITTASVSDKTFHFSEHTSRIYADISERVPELEKDARYLAIRSHMFNLRMLDNASKEEQNKYAEQYQLSRRFLRNNMKFILVSSIVPMQEKAENFLRAYGIYQPLRNAWRKVRGNQPG